MNMSTPSLPPFDNVDAAEALEEVYDVDELREESKELPNQNCFVAHTDSIVIDLNEKMFADGPEEHGNSDLSVEFADLVQMNIK